MNSCSEANKLNKGGRGVHYQTQQQQIICSDLNTKHLQNVSGDFLSTVPDCVHNQVEAKKKENSIASESEALPFPLIDDIETTHREDENSDSSEEPPPILVLSAGKSNEANNENDKNTPKPFIKVMDEKDAPPEVDEEGIDVELRFNYNHAPYYVTDEDEGELEDDNDLAATSSEVEKQMEEGVASEASSDPMPTTTDDDAQFDYSVDGMELRPSDSSNMYINYHPSYFYVNDSSSTSTEVSSQQQVQQSSSFSSYSLASLVLLSQVAMNRIHGVSSSIVSSDAAITQPPLPPRTVTAPIEIKKAKTPEKLRPSNKMSPTYPDFKIQTNKNKEASMLNCLCKHCGKLLKNPYTLRNHYRRVHQNFRRFRCDLCDRRFWEVTPLRIHKNKVHSAAVPCEGCNIRFSQGSLSKHLKECAQYINIQERKHKEQDFRMISNDEAVAVSNIRSMTNQHGMSNEKKYVFMEETGKYHCTSCPRQYESSSSVKRHHESLHLKIIHRCDLCIKEFKFKHTLEAHRRREHDVGTVDLKHDCNICGKRFFTAFNMKRHKTTVHLNIRNHPCDLCDKVYKEAGTLKDHRRKTHFAYFDPLSFTLEVPTMSMAAVAERKPVASGSEVE